MKKHVVIFEVRGGSDKGPYGFRKDSKPIIDSLKKGGGLLKLFFTEMKTGVKFTDIRTKKQMPISVVLTLEIYTMKRVIFKC